jgi:hypothetical protein
LIITLLIALASAAASSAALAAAGDGLITRGTGSPPLLPPRTNGWVQQHPQVYLLFWGPKWKTDPTHQNAVAFIRAAFKDLAGSQYNNIITQYYGGTGAPGDKVHNDVRLMDDPPGIDASTPPSAIDMETDVGAEAEHAFDLFQLVATSHTNNQVIIFPQQGTTYGPIISLSCGMHFYDPFKHLPYAVVPYPEETGGCKTVPLASDANKVDVAQTLAWHAIHEYAETATDPELSVNLLVMIPPYKAIVGNGWNTYQGVSLTNPDKNLFTPKETADLCEGYYPFGSPAGVPSPYPTYTSRSSGQTYTLPFLWSQYSANIFGGPVQGRGCVQHEGIEYPSPDRAPPFTGKHTVQGSILARYQSLHADTGVMGQPVSEEMPIAGGAVSYFAANVCSGGFAGGGGALYYGPNTPAPKVFAVYGCIFHQYAQAGGPNSPLGFPISDVYNTPNGQEVDFQHGYITSEPNGVTVHMGGERPAVGQNDNGGRLEVFQWGTDGALWHKWQLTPGGSWSGWTSLGGALSGPPVVVSNDDRRLEVFARGTDGGLWHIWQLAGGGSTGWSTWASLGGVFRSNPSVTNNVDGRLEVFVRGADNAIYHRYQLRPGGSTGWSGWASLGGVVSSSPGTESTLYGIEVFVLGDSDGSLWHKWQQGANGAFVSAWYGLGGISKSDPVDRRDSNWSEDFFILGTGQYLYRLSQFGAGGNWSGWISLGCCFQGTPDAKLNILDGRLEVFARGTDGALHHRWQLAPNGAWSGWASLGGFITTDPVVSSNGDARLEVFARDGGGSIWHIWQLSPGGGWSNWAQL